jgi:hypothetical protein
VVEVGSGTVVVVVGPDVVVVEGAELEEHAWTRSIITTPTSPTLRKIDTVTP